MLESIERWLAIAERVSDKRAETLVAEMRNAVEALKLRPRLIYLATPYSSREPRAAEIQAERYEEACYIAARLLRKGYRVFSPIAASHGIATIGKLAGDWQAWQAFDEHMISLCDELWVATEMDGWEQSVGIAAEIEFARSIGKPVVFYGSDSE